MRGARPRLHHEEWAQVQARVLSFLRLDGDVFRHDRLNAALEEARQAHEKVVKPGEWAVRQGSLKHRSSVAQASTTTTTNQ